MTNQPPFSAVLLLGIAIIVSITAWLFSYWDRQEEKLFAKQEAAQKECEKVGGIVTDMGCRPLRRQGR